MAILPVLIVLFCLACLIKTQDHRRLWIQEDCRECVYAVFYSSRGLVQKPRAGTAGKRGMGEAL